MKAKFLVFQSHFELWDSLFQQAAEFMTGLGPDRDRRFAFPGKDGWDRDGLVLGRWQVAAAAA